jgi:uncharacterized protein YecE (DUF72 family)
VGFCNIDQPRFGKSLRGTAHVTAPVGYVCLHGRNYKRWFEADNRNDRYNYLYKPKELEEWKEKITHIAKETEKNFVVANNHFKGGSGKFPRTQKYALWEASEGAQAPG